MKFKQSALSRRRMLQVGAASLVVANVARAASVRPASQSAALSPDAALAEIMAGNTRFVAGASVAHLQDVEILRMHAAEGQSPIAAVLACADSRVPVEMVFDEPIGRLFVTRIAGNITTPEIIASLEYAVAALGVRAVVVMGHTGCGAVKSALSNAEVPGQISALFPALLPAVYLSKSHDPQVVSRMNAVVQTATLINASTVIEGKVISGDLKVVPIIYDVGSGKVDILPIPASFRVSE